LFTIQTLNTFGASAVGLGGTAAASFSVLNDSAIVATAPAGSVGTVDVQVTTPSGTSSAVSADHFTYSAVTTPAVTSLSVTSASTAGGTALTITGTGLLNTTVVTFGGIDASFVVVSDTSLSVTTPPDTAGGGDVVVSVPGPPRHPDATPTRRPRRLR
jgi:hypothetical protein